MFDDSSDDALNAEVFQALLMRSNFQAPTGSIGTVGIGTWLLMYSDILPPCVAVLVMVGISLTVGESG